MNAVCLLFSGRRGLDDLVLRESVLRIPEVSRRLNEAQKLIESLLPEECEDIDFFSHLQSSEDVFGSKQKLKSLLSSIVQIGLFDRYVRYRNRPEILVGPFNGCSAMLVCADRQSFGEFIAESEFFQDLAGTEKKMTHLSGLKIEKYGVLCWNNEGAYEDYSFEAKEVSTIMQDLQQENLFQNCVLVGPHTQFRTEEFVDAGLNDIQMVNSIDMDPILSSFWRSA
ncbi:MAG: hypothetical protein AAF203_06530 [Pseudomonadota bacterium]